VLLAVITQYRRAGGRLRAGAGLAVAILAAVVFAATITREGPLERLLGTDPSELGTDGRLKIWRGGIAAFRESPLWGWGLGTFREAFRPYQPAGLDGLVEQAHDEPLQLLVTGGVLGACLALVGFGALAFRLVTGFFAQRHREESAWALAGLGAFLALALHGLVEFNLSIPSVPATAAVLLGLASASAAWHRGTPTAAEAHEPEA
jgi:O-antigen ligase